MVFKRTLFPASLASHEALTADLIGMGVRLSGIMHRNSNIENTLLAASIEGLSGDGRVLSLLVDWVQIHNARINADRLVQLILRWRRQQPAIFAIFWAAIGQWLGTDSRFAKLRRLAPKKRFDFLVAKHGEDERFQNTCLRVPQGVFRHRPSDVLSPEELACIHLPYHYRIMMGPSYRADMWAYLYLNPETSTAELARICHGSYPTAFAVKRDFAVIGDFMTIPATAL